MGGHLLRVSEMDWSLTQSVRNELDTYLGCRVTGHLFRA